MRVLSFYPGLFSELAETTLVFSETDLGSETEHSRSRSRKNESTLV